MLRKDIVLLTSICNSIIKTGYFPAQWKVAQTAMIPKSGKPLEEVGSYRPISLLAITSKIFETATPKRLRPILEGTRILLGYQFGFRQQHSAIEQVHRITEIMKRNFKKRKQYYSVAVIDITQAFDKVWHPGLFFKIRK
jgi:hypothetical protein